MFLKIKNFITHLVYENGVPSLTRVVAVFVILASVILPVTVTLFLLWTKQDFHGYADMLSWSRDGILGGGGIQAFNKFTNSKYNSADGELPAKNSIPNPLGDSK